MTTLWWPSWSAFVEMGGYGLYVWGSFAVVAAAVGLEIVALRARARAARRRAQDGSHGGSQEGSIG